MKGIRGFFGFVKNIAKDSVMLLLKYIFVGIFWIILTIVANKFELNDLTYFNAIFSLMVLSCIIPFGISQGIGVFINQNIDDKKSKKRHIKVGFLLNLIASIIILLMIFIFKELIFERLIIVEITDNYKFFYMMLPVIFMVMNCDYFSNILKILKESKVNLLFCMVDFGVTLLFIGLFYSLGALSLNILAICYILTKIICMPSFTCYAFKYLTKDKYDIIKILKTKTNFKIKELKQICQFAATETIWNIGYIISGLVLLKNSELIYNSYTYFENVLSILNGLYFSFINICSITICSHLGRKEYDKAYQNGKYSIVLIIIIWSIIAGSTILFQGIITSGMNADIQTIGKTILLPYMVIQLLRFLDWGVFTYITSTCGDLKLISTMNYIWLVYFIILFILSNFIKINEVLLILLIGLDGLVNTIIGLRYFKSKKWLKKVTG